MTYNTRFIEEARAELQAIGMVAARRILAKLTELETDPFGFATTSLVGEPDVRRLRVGDWRVLYRVAGVELAVLVIHLRHRSVAYDQGVEGRGT